jgi:hypothetical protein
MGGDEFMGARNLGKKNPTIQKKVLPSFLAFAAL